MRLLLPRTLDGSAALSVEMFTKLPTLFARAARNTFAVPTTLVSQASRGNASSIGRCFRAAAWKTTSGRRVANVMDRASGSLMSARTTTASLLVTRP